MKIKTFTKKALSLIVAAVMMLGVMSPVISAVGPIEDLHKDNAGDGTLHYVSLGASNTNGYGHHGYLDDEIYEDPLAAPKANMNDYGYDKAPANAYPALIRDALAAKTGRAVELHQLAISSMRVEEVLWLLDDTFEPDEYMNWRFTGGKSWFDMAHKEGGREALRVEYREYIANADVITVDLGWNNFGVYAFNNIMTILKEGGSRYWKAPAFDRVVDAGMEEEYYAIRDKVLDRVTSSLDLSGTALSDETLEKLVDVLAYAAFGACYNYDKVIERIYALNPDATVVTINIQNLADELTVDLDGNEIALGDLYGELIEFVDFYRTSQSPYADKVSFAYAGDDGDVETFRDEFLSWDGDPATLSQDMKDLFDMYDDNIYARSKIEYMMIGPVLEMVFAKFTDVFSKFDSTGNYTYDFHVDLEWVNDVESLDKLNFTNPIEPEKSNAVIKVEEKLSYYKDKLEIKEEDGGLTADERKEYDEYLKYCKELNVYHLELYGQAVSKHLYNLRNYTKDLNPDPNVNSLGANAYDYVFENMYNYYAEQNGNDLAYSTVYSQDTSNPGYYVQFRTVMDSLYNVYQETLNYSYDLLGTIIQYSLQFNTFYMTSDAMQDHNDNTDELLNDVVDTFTTNTTYKFYEELGKIGLVESGTVAPEITVNEELFSDSLIQAVAALEVRYDFGNSFFAHPSVNGNKQICKAVMDALENGSHTDAFVDKKLNQYIDIFEYYLDPYYQEKYAALKANGTIDAMLGGLDTLESALDALESEAISFVIPEGVDKERAENIKALLLEEIDLTRISAAELRKLLNTEDLDFGTDTYGKLVAIQNHLADHGETLAALAVELGLLAEPYVVEAFEILGYYADVAADMAKDAYAYLENGVKEFHSEYLEFTELVGSYVDRVDPELGAAVRAYLLDTPADALNIICVYGEDAVLKLALEVSATFGKLHSSVSAIVMILAEHGADICAEIASSEEYKALVADIEAELAELVQLYNDINESPILTAVDIDLVLAQHKAELESLYSRLVALVQREVEEYDAEVAELLWTALSDVVDALGVLEEGKDSYLVWLDGRTDMMLGALLQSFIENSAELGDAAEATAWKYLNMLDAFISDACAQITAQLELQIAILKAELAELEKQAADALRGEIERIEKMIAELESALEKACSSIKAELRALAIDLLERAVDELIKASPEINEALYGYIINNPEEVIEFFEKYGHYIEALADEYGDEALTVCLAILAEYGDDVLKYVLENPTEAIESICEWYERYGSHILPLVKVYLDVLGVDYYTLEDIEAALERLEAMIDELEEKLNDKVNGELIPAIRELIAQIRDALKEQAIDSAEALLDKLAELIGDVLDGALKGEYLADEDSFYVGITGVNSEYAELLAGALGLGDSYAVMNWNELDKALLEKADFVTIGYDYAPVHNFALTQLLGAVASYGDTSFREQAIAFLHEVLDGNVEDELIEKYADSINGYIDDALEHPILAGKQTLELDWAALVGAENVAEIEALLDEAARLLAEQGITGDYVYSVDIAAILAEYEMTFAFLEDGKTFDVSVPAAELALVAVESYLYASIALELAYAEAIAELTANSPDAKVVLLGQYNPLMDVTVAGVRIPLAEIGEKLGSLASAKAFAFALALPNVTYVDISEVETSFGEGELEITLDALVEYLSEPKNAIFTDAGNLYVVEQILGAFGLECKHVYDNCFDLECNICGAAREAEGHIYEAVVMAPTCTSDGYTSHTCTLCNVTYYTDIVPALGHKYDNACDADCNVCGETRTPDAHSFGEWTVVKEATTTEKGQEKRVCSVCGHTEYRDVPMLSVEPTPSPAPSTPVEPDNSASVIIITVVVSSIVALAGAFLYRRFKK